MLVKIDFNSEEAIYVQLINQIIFGIANAEINEGDNLPSVRDLADDIGINMHTVNKAYGILRQEGFIKLDRRKGAIIAIDVDKLKAKQELCENMRVIMARAICQNISPQEVHDVVDQIICEFERR